MILRRWLPHRSPVTFVVAALAALLDDMRPGRGLQRGGTRRRARRLPASGPEFAGLVPVERPRSDAHKTVRRRRIAAGRAAYLPNGVEEQRGFSLVPLHDFLVHGLQNDPVDYGPIGFPELTAPDDLALFDRIGAAMCYMLPLHADVNDTFVQALATIGLSVADGFSWRGLDESVVAGLRRAAPVVDQIIDERWQSMSDTVNGWRGSLASGRCSYDWPLNAANTKNQVGTELADQVVYLNCRVDGDGHRSTEEPLRAARTRSDAGGLGDMEPARYDETCSPSATRSTRSATGTPPPVHGASG